MRNPFTFIAQKVDNYFCVRKMRQAQKKQSGTKVETARGSSGGGGKSIMPGGVTQIINNFDGSAAADGLSNSMKKIRKAKKRLHNHSGKRYSKERIRARMAKASRKIRYKKMRAGKPC